MQTGHAIKIAKTLDERSFQTQLLSANARYEIHCCHASGAQSSRSSDASLAAATGIPGPLRSGWIQRVVRQLQRLCQPFRSVGRLSRPAAEQTETRATFLMETLWELSAAGYGKSAAAMAKDRCRSPFMPLADMESDHF